MSVRLPFESGARSSDGATPPADVSLSRPRRSLMTLLYCCRVIRGTCEVAGTPGWQVTAPLLPPVPEPPLPPFPEPLLPPLDEVLLPPEPPLDEPLFPPEPVLPLIDPVHPPVLPARAIAMIPARLLCTACLICICMFALLPDGVAK